MKTLHLYLLRQILAALMMTVLVFTFVLILGNILTEILGLLVNRQTSLFTVAQALGLLIPFVLVFALPMGLLTATLLVFGRLGADHELTAVRASGVSLVALVTPVLLLSVALSGVSALINTQVAPWSRVAYKQLIAAVGLSKFSTLLQEKTFIRDFDKRIVYLGKVDGTNLSNILVYDLDSSGQVEAYISASSGRISVDVTNGNVRVELFDAWRTGMVETRRMRLYLGESEIYYTNSAPARASRTKISNMTLLELWDELKDLERRVVAPPSVRGLSPEERDQVRQELLRQRTDLTLPVLVQINYQLSFSFACIGFTLVGIPLGIRAHRRETTFGIAMALILVLVYYSFFVLARALDTTAGLYPHLLLWVPNFIFQGVGGILLWRANRGM
jgi:lipopolysaccharide export system permease protein